MLMGKCMNCGERSENLAPAWAPPEHPRSVKELRTGRTFILVCAKCVQCLPANQEADRELATVNRRAETTVERLLCDRAEVSLQRELDWVRGSGRPLDEFAGRIQALREMIGLARAREFSELQRRLKDWISLK